MCVFIEDLAACLLAMLRTARLTGAHWRRVAAARLLSTRAEATTSVVLDKATIRRNHLLEAFTFVRAYATAGFDESVQASLVLNVDIKRTEERVRGRVSLPHGTGKAVRLAVFTRDHAQEALDAGADVVGLEELVAQVVGGTIDFERCIATPDAMPALAKAARVLGPKQVTLTLPPDPPPRSTPSSLPPTSPPSPTYTSPHPNPPRSLVPLLPLTPLPPSLLQTAHAKHQARNCRHGSCGGGGAHQRGRGELTAPPPPQHAHT